MILWNSAILGLIDAEDFVIPEIQGSSGVMVG